MARSPHVRRRFQSGFSILELLVVLAVLGVVFSLVALTGRIFVQRASERSVVDTFQQAVWRALVAIAYGETRSYTEVARAIGKPNAVRAVGAANGANPLALVVPCHRVIAADGSLGGYGGGLELKARLLAMERSLSPGPRLL